MHDKVVQGFAWLVHVEGLCVYERCKPNIMRLYKVSMSVGASGNGMCVCLL